MCGADEMLQYPTSVHLPAPAAGVAGRAGLRLLIGLNVYPQPTYQSVLLQRQFSEYYYAEPQLQPQKPGYVPRPVAQSDRLLNLSVKTPSDARTAYSIHHGNSGSAASRIDIFALQGKAVDASRPSNAVYSSDGRTAGDAGKHHDKALPDAEERLLDMPRDPFAAPHVPVVAQGLAYLPQTSAAPASYLPLNSAPPHAQPSLQNLLFLAQLFLAQMVPGSAFRQPLNVLPQTLQTHQTMLPAQAPHGTTQPAQMYAIDAALVLYPQYPPSLSLAQPSASVPNSPGTHSQSRLAPANDSRYKLQLFHLSSSASRHRKKPLVSLQSPLERATDKRALFLDAELLPAAKAVFERLLKEILEINSHDYHGFLVGMLQQSKSHVPLDNFHILLYNSPADALRSPEGSDGELIDRQAADDGTRDQLEVYSRVLEIFKYPKFTIDAIPGPRYEQKKLACVHYHEFLRTFLALKIIADALVVSDDRAKNCPTTPRLAIYKLYYVLSQKLFLRYPSQKGVSSEHELILGVSKLGKLIKAMHPNLVVKRLGPRGESKYHYIGLTLNMDLYTDETRDLCAHSLEELTAMFSKMRRPSLDTLTQMPTPHARTFQSCDLTATFMDAALALRPLQSFIKPTCMFPPGQLSPAYCYDSHHAHKDVNSWFYVVRQELHDSLAKLDLAISLFTNYFESSEPLENSQEWLMNNVLLLINQLAQSPHFVQKHCLHLFLFVVVWVFPIMLCLDMTKSEAFLFHLRANVHTLVLNFEEKCVSNPYVSVSHLKSFVGILNKILNLDDVANSLFKAKRAPAVIENMCEDIAGLVQPLPEDKSSNVLERLLACGLVDSLNAYKFVPPSKNGVSTDDEVIRLVDSIAERMKRSIVWGLQELVKNLDAIQNDFDNGMDPMKMHFEYLYICLSFFYDSCFDDVLVKRFTVAIINNYLLLVSNQIMKYIFRIQNQRASMVLNTTFRHWWVVLSFLQEYCGVVLETIGIHHMLNSI